MDRRHFVSGAGIGLATTSFGLLDIARATAAQFPEELASSLQQPSSGDAIRPFRIHVSESQLAELRRRLHATRWPERETVDDASQGVQLGTMQQLVNYWAKEYDWRRVESRLNSLPQYVTNIDGLDIHFIHVRSKHENALPLIVTHGWPGSVIEQLKIIDPLTNPTAHGGAASDAFHVVIPSLPGYGFSGKPHATGWNTERIAHAWVVLMKRLRYTKFVSQGGDWGAAVSGVMAKQAPPELLGIHVNLPQTIPAEIGKPLRSGDPAPANLSPDETRAYEQLSVLYAKHAAYLRQMGTRPQTLYGLTDSPVSLASWMLDHDERSYEKIAALFGGQPYGDITRDDILDNITLYWLTNTGISAARIYWENPGSVLGAANVSVPAAVSIFPEEIYQAPRSWTERAYHKLIYFNQVDKGGHFAAWEQPQLFSQELRAAFKPLRETNA